ncbi:lysozyme [Seminibacterium arietis]|uniref:Lysozyme n=1 Tax=Seminibacterium arietis TaxID=1173502 RepID=A0ABW3I9C2_9PAST
MKKPTLLLTTACSVLAIIGIVLNNPDGIRTSQQGLALIGDAEGCRRDPYYCPANVLTVGIGSSAINSKIDIKKKLTDEEIAERWKADLKIAEQCVNKYANGEKLPQGAFESAVSITFNVGCGKMRYSTLFKYARQGNIKAMCNQFTRWIYIGNKPSNGLKQRREKERQLCLHS